MRCPSAIAPWAVASGIRSRHAGPVRPDPASTRPSRNAADLPRRARRQIRFRRLVASRHPEPGGRQAELAVANVQRTGQGAPATGVSSPRLQASACRSLARLASFAGLVRATSRSKSQRGRWSQVTSLQARAHGLPGASDGQVDADAIDGPAIAIDAATDDAQAVLQGRDAGLAWRARRLPALQRRQVQDGRIEFDALRDQVGAAGANRAPGHRDEHAIGAKQGMSVARALRDQVAQHQLRRSAQPIARRARCGDAQAKRRADAIQQECAGALRLQQVAADKRKHREQDGREDGEAGQAAPASAHRHRRGGAHPVSESGSSASTKASASNTRRSSGPSPMPA